MKKSLLVTLLAVLAVGLAAQGNNSSLASGKKALINAGADWRLVTPKTSWIELPKGIARDADAFLKDYHQALGLVKAEDLRAERETKDISQRNYLRFSRYHAGYPVLGAQVVLQLSSGGEPRRLLGQIIAPDRFLAPAHSAGSVTTSVPPLPYATLVAAARAQLEADYPDARQWTAIDQGISWVAEDGNAQTYQLAHGLEITAPDGPLAERVFVNQQSGRIVFRQPLHCSLQRQLYKTNTSSANLMWKDGDAFPGTLESDEQEMIQATGEIYNLFHRTFGRKGYDGNYGSMLNVVDASLQNCPNAFARGNTVSLCNGVVGDDIVGHEWTHNYLRSMNGLNFSYESGSIHEAFSDIFGEVIDLLNNRGQDTDDAMKRDSCNDGNLRWRIAEDATAFDSYLRDMWHPGCKDHPDARTSEDYFCNPDSPRDGIHINAGVINKTFSLLVDGGVLNGDTVRAIGMTKALHIFYHVADKYMTPMTDFPALAQLLQLATLDLRGLDLPALTLTDLPAMNSEQKIDAFDSLQIVRVISATGLMDSTVCDLSLTLAQSPPELCKTDLAPGAYQLLQQDWEAGFGNWTMAENTENPEDWIEKPWQLTTVLPDGRPGQAIFAPNTNEGDCRLSRGNGTTSLTSPVLQLTGFADEFILSFSHYFSTQQNRDGGIVELSINGEAFSPIPGSSFLYNGYNGTLTRVGLNDNPLAGMEAFHGADANSSTGSWGESQIDLIAAGAKAGDDVQLRWTLGQDGCEGWLGWYLDDVSVTYCAEAALPVTLLDFRASGRKNYVSLQWQTLLENENEGFFVERREDGGASFTDLGFVAGGAERYSFDDHAVRHNETYLYRLRQRNLDGSQQYSSVVSAHLLSEEDFRVFPNPVSDELIVESSLELTNISLYDASGRRVRRVQGTGKKAVLDLRSLPAGVYWLREGAVVRRVVKGE